MRFKKKMIEQENSFVCYEAVRPRPPIEILRSKAVLVFHSCMARTTPLGNAGRLWTELFYPCHVSLYSRSIVTV